MRFLLFASGWGEEERALYGFCREGGYELHLYMVGDEPIPVPEGVRTRPYRSDQRRYDLGGRLFDHVFVTAPLPDPLRWLERVHSAVMNGGRVFVAHFGSLDPEAWERAMEERDFVAVHPIESEGLRMVSGKKMHGWGSR